MLTVADRDPPARRSAGADGARGGRREGRRHGEADASWRGSRARASIVCDSLPRHAAERRAPREPIGPHGPSSARARFAALSRVVAARSRASARPRRCEFVKGWFAEHATGAARSARRRAARRRPRRVDADLPALSLSAHPRGRRPALAGRPSPRRRSISWRTGRSGRDEVGVAMPSVVTGSAPRKLVEIPVG